MEYRPGIWYNVPQFEFFMWLLLNAQTGFAYQSTSQSRSESGLFIFVTMYPLHEETYRSCIIDLSGINISINPSVYLEICFHMFRRYVQAL